MNKRFPLLIFLTLVTLNIFSQDQMDCGEWKMNGDNSWWTKCNQLKNDKAVAWWSEQIYEHRFEQNTQQNNYLIFRRNGDLYGWLPLTDAEDRGINMQGAWEFNGNGNSKEKAFITVYAGQSKCTYTIMKKGSLYWLNNVEKNYSNICPSMLTSRSKVALLSDIPKDNKN